MNTSPGQLDSFTASQSVKTLERVKNLSHADFINNYVIPRRPVVLEDVTASWPALNKWTPEFWQKNYGSKQVEIDGKTLTMHEVIALALESSNEKRAPYYRNIRIGTVFPELMADILPYPKCCTPNWFLSDLFKPIKKVIAGGGGQYELFIGGAGRVFPYLHYDSPGAHTFINQIAGRKQFILFQPSDGQYLYPKPGVGFAVSEIPDVERVDLEKFPLYPKATRIDCVVGPGDTLFMPCGWWHTAKMASFSISLGMDVANETNWQDVLNYMGRKAKYRNPLPAFAYMTYMRTAGAILAKTQKI